MERLLWWVLAGSRGGASRARIMSALEQRPYNANQLAELLGLDYKTIRHHLKVLENNVIIVAEGARYSKLYYLSKNMDGHQELFHRICQGLELELKSTAHAVTSEPDKQTDKPFSKALNNDTESQAPEVEEE